MGKGNGWDGEKKEKQKTTKGSPPRGDAMAAMRCSSQETGVTGMKAARKRGR